MNFAFYGNPFEPGLNGEFSRTVGAKAMSPRSSSHWQAPSAAVPV